MVILKCDTEHDTDLIQAILDGNGFSVSQLDPNEIVFNDIYAGQNSFHSPRLTTQECRDNAICVDVTDTKLDISQIGDYIEELKRLRDIMEEIAISVDESYVL